MDVSWSENNMRLHGHLGKDRSHILLPMFLNLEKDLGEPLLPNFAPCWFGLDHISPSNQVQC